MGTGNHKVSFDFKVPRAHCILLLRLNQMLYFAMCLSYHFNTGASNVARISQWKGFWLGASAGGKGVWERSPQRWAIFASFE